MVYNYTYSKHNETLLDGLSAQRQNQSHFCDITIKTRDDLQNEVIIFGHKCVLATTSDHLNSIINMEENQQHNLEYDMSTIADAGIVSHPPLSALALGIVRRARLDQGSSDKCETMERMHQSLGRIFLFWRADIHNTQFRKNETSYQRIKNEKYRRRIFTEDRGRY